MNCPFCTTSIHLIYNDDSIVFGQSRDSLETQGFEVHGGYCPKCGRPVVTIKHGEYVFSPNGSFIRGAGEETIIVPKNPKVKVPPSEVPEDLRKDFVEAAAVLPVSSKASAALSRRILQRLFHENFNIKKTNLAQEIDAFIALPDVPTFLSAAVDAIRTVGNFAAHPMKNDAEGTIVDVEPGEAEWLIDVLESMFDFAYVQPQKLAKRRDKLNKKLKDIGKPELKGPHS